MASPPTDAIFSGSIAALYQSCLGPLLFEPYADDLARRLADVGPGRILETAAGTGIVTGALLDRLPRAEIVATDLNPAMLEVAAGRLGSPRLTIRQADAQQLPFPDESFDAVACQFGLMFFPDRPAACAEARRVLRPGGRLIFNVWDRIDRNPVTAVVAKAVADCFPDDPPNFFERTPFGLHDRAAIEAELSAAGFGGIVAETVEKRSCRPAREAAIGLCHGTPLRSEIEARDASRLDEVTDAAAAALAGFGDVEGVDAPMSAHVFVATR